MVLTKILAVVALIFAVLPSNSEAEHLRSKGLTLFQKKCFFTLKALRWQWKFIEFQTEELR